MNSNFRAIAFRPSPSIAACMPQHRSKNVTLTEYVTMEVTLFSHVNKNGVISPGSYLETPRRKVHLYT